MHRNLEPESTETVEHDILMELGPDGELMEVTKDDTDVRQ